MSGRVQPAAMTVCAACPWRLTNQGKRHPDGWYTKKNLRFLWSRLRRGEGMTCHPTDQTNPLPAGTRPVPDGIETRVCTGSLILQQREFMILQEYLLDGRGMAAYRAHRPRGLTREGAGELLSDAVFSGTPFGRIVQSKPNLNNEDVGLEGLPWEPR